MIGILQDWFPEHHWGLLSPLEFFQELSWPWNHPSFWTTTWTTSIASAQSGCDMPWPWRHGSWLPIRPCSKSEKRMHLAGSWSWRRWFYNINQSPSTQVYKELRNKSSPICESIPACFNVFHFPSSLIHRQWTQGHEAKRQQSPPVDPRLPRARSEADDGIPWGPTKICSVKTTVHNSFFLFSNKCLI